MNPAWAALIGAVVASAVALASQFLAHALALRRDRRNQRRARAHEVIVRAAQALYVTRSMSDDEFASLDLPPDSVGASIPEEVRATAHLLERHCEAMTELQIEFGHSHPLLDSYIEAYTVCAKALTLAHGQEQLDDETLMANFEKIARALRNAQMTRDAWMTEAKETVEAI
jgi:hypothetical protein